MRRCTELLLALACITAFVACNKPEIEDCRRACWNYHKVLFWDAVDEEVKGLPPEEAAAIRAQKEKEFQASQERAEDPGMLNCITDCQNNANKDQVRCLQEKETATALRACLE